MNANKPLWEKGDFTQIAATMRESGQALVDKLGITKGVKVLDLGCGDGATAIPAARLGADVLGVDLTAKLVAAGNARAKAEGLANSSFQVSPGNTMLNDCIVLPARKSTNLSLLFTTLIFQIMCLFLRK